jgi:hypothetical protein
MIGRDTVEEARENHLSQSDMTVNVRQNLARGCVLTVSIIPNKNIAVHRNILRN